MARTGKIARLPLAVREELNLRLLDNENGQDILAWLNDLDVTKEVITRSFAGEPISDANLSLWRTGGFAEWLKEQEHVQEVKRLSEYSLKLAKAAGGNLSKGMLAANVGKIQKALELHHSRRHPFFSCYYYDDIKSDTSPAWLKTWFIFSVVVFGVSMLVFWIFNIELS